jgi:hypothetical protein
MTEFLNSYIASADSFEVIEVELGRFYECAPVRREVSASLNDLGEFTRR